MARSAFSVREIHAAIQGQKEAEARTLATAKFSRLFSG